MKFLFKHKYPIVSILSMDYILVYLIVSKLVLIDNACAIYFIYNRCTNMSWWFLKLKTTFILKNNKQYFIEYNYNLFPLFVPKL